MRNTVIAMALIAIIAAPILAQEPERQGRPFELLEGETNLALGRPYLYSAVPSYRLTTNETDLQDLTDGELGYRNDDRIWWDANAVAWHGEPSVNIQLDLGEVQPIGEIGIRLLGGAEQGGLKFPDRVIALVSDDAENWREVGRFNRLDEADLQRFGVPAEKGVAWTFPLRFQGLQAAGRYVGLVIHGQTSFIASDEMWVFEGAHAAADAREYPAYDGSFLVHHFTPGGLTAYFTKPTIYAGSNFQSFQTLQGYDNRPEETLGKACDLIVDLPEGVTLRRWMLNPRFGGATADEFETGPVEDEGGSFTRYVIPTRGVWITDWGTLFFATDREDGWTGTARLGCRWDTGMQEPESYTIEAVHVEPVERFEQIHLSMAWMTQMFWQKWPDFLESYAACGFNAVPIFPRYAKADDAALYAEIERAREMGLDVVNNSSPLHAVKGQAKDLPEVMCQIDGEPANWLCPSYRGQAWQEEVNLVAERYSWTNAEWFFYDCEVFTGWYGGNRQGNDEAQKCSRCQAAYQGFDGTWDEFIAHQGAEFYRAVKQRIAEISPGVTFQAGAYGVKPEAVYHDVWDWNVLYPDHHQFSMPSLYGFRPAPIGDAIRRNRELMRYSDIIPWLQPGDLGEIPAETLRCILLEVLLNGGRGAGYYTSAGFDAADMRAVAQVVAMLRPYEEIIVGGELLPGAACDVETVHLSAIRSGDRGLLLVGEYETAGPVECTVTPPAGFRIVSELTTTGATDCPPGPLTVTLDQTRGRVYLLAAD